jgi:hypothetical protein
MSNDSKEFNENSPSEISVEHQLNPPTPTTTTFQINQTHSPEMSRSQSNTPKSSERKQSVEIITQRPLSPITRHRVKKRENPNSTNIQRTRSNSPRKTFSYLTSNRLNIRKWKQQQRQLTKEQEDNRIYKENRQQLERLAKIAKEPSVYPSVHIEQERLRDRHVIDHHRKVLKNFIPILKDNLCLVDRLANVKGVIDVKKMDEDFARHQQVLKQDTINRKKTREIAASQRHFILPKINLKS